MLKDEIHFEHDTRVFLVHEPLKTGEWQDSWEKRGPNPGGILCNITLQKGKYEGQPVVPQTFDERYFKVLLMAPYSPGPPEFGKDHFRSAVAGIGWQLVRAAGLQWAHR